MPHIKCFLSIIGVRYKSIQEYEESGWHVQFRDGGRSCVLYLRDHQDKISIPSVFEIIMSSNHRI